MILISQRNASTPCEGGNCYGRENSADEKERHGHAAAHPAGLCCYRPAVFYSIILLDESLFPGILLTILSIAYWVAGIFLFCGLKVLKPQEALVLTLFGDYIGTLKGQGFYWVNPFCTAVNPAAGTKLSQSGDVNSGETGMAVLLKAGNSSSQTAESTSKKISLK